MSLRGFLGKMTPKFILLRFGLSLALAALLIPLVVRFINHEDLTVRTFVRYFLIVGFPVMILTLVHFIDARAKARSEFDRKNDA
jgi:hypothetical protein